MDKIGFENELKNKILRKSTLEYVGGFGTGKSTFLKNFFEKNINEFEALWFNAFEYDYSSNPKVVFVNEVIMSILEKLPLARFEDRAKKFLKIIKNIFFNSIALNLQKWGLDVKNAKEDNEWTTIIKNYQNEKSKINELKKLLIETINELTPNDNEKKNLVLVIDDLDRARPDFALEVLEISKHIFDVENLSIIFVYDKQTMDEMTIKKYGKPSGERYLKKYIKDTYVHKNVDLLNNESDYLQIAFKNTYNIWTAREIDIFNKRIGFEKILKMFSDSTLYYSQWKKPEYWLLIGFLFAIKEKEEELLISLFKILEKSYVLNDEICVFEKVILETDKEKWNPRLDNLNRFLKNNTNLSHTSANNYIKELSSLINNNKTNQQFSELIKNIFQILFTN